MKLKFYTLAILVLAAVSLQAQDIHFSQYYASPLTLNPALTGKFDGLYRINAIYRGQYYGVTQSNSLYRTPALSVDFSLLKDKMNGNALGVGLAVVNDQQNSGAGKISATTISLNLGYTLNLGKKKSTQLSVGFQPSYTLKRIGGDFQFGEGFDGFLNYDKTSAGHETVANTGKKNFFNFSYGLFFNTHPIELLTFYAGFAMNNVARPNVAAISTTSTDKLPFRYIVHGGFEITPGTKWVIIPGFLYQNMAKANEGNVGLTVGYNLINNVEKDKKATIFLGLWNRIGADVNSPAAYRNITPKFGIEYQRFRVNFAYDIDLGKMSKDAKTANTKLPQAYELALTYIGFGGKAPKENNFLFNPRY